MILIFCFYVHFTDSARFGQPAIKQILTSIASVSESQPIKCHFLQSIKVGYKFAWLRAIAKGHENGMYPLNVYQGWNTTQSLQ